MQGPPLPGAPWFRLQILPSGGGTTQGTAIVVTLPGVTQTVTISSSKFTVNPGVLANGRRPDRPGS